jgi:hypothetical protein
MCQGRGTLGRRQAIFVLTAFVASMAFVIYLVS